MYNKLRYLILGLFLIITSGALGQSPTSPLFGKDIVIHDMPDRDQRNVAVCSAFNGWLYAAFSYDSSLYTHLMVVRSTDHGITWNPFYIFSYAAVKYMVVSSLDIVTVGNNAGNLRLIIGFSHLDTTNVASSAALISVNGITGEVANLCLIPGEQDGINYVDLCSDAGFPASGSNPGSFAFLYSRYDSVCIRTSSDGGNTLDGWQLLGYYYPIYTMRVALAYGQSPSCNTGRYFAVWETKENDSDPAGHIYYSHSEPNFNSPFTTPVCLDSLNPSTINSASYPMIACQYGNVDNDSSNLTTIVMFETPYASAGGGIQAYSNKSPTLDSDFVPFQFTSGQDDNKMPSAAYNPYDSTFVITWFDNTTGGLVYATNDFNLSNPDEWDLVSAGYNDLPLTTTPYPKVYIDPVDSKGACAWIGDSVPGKGKALFDSQASTYTAVQGKSGTEKEGFSKVIPNPCDHSVTIQFEALKSEPVTLSIHTLLGELVLIRSGFYCSPGSNNLMLETRNISDGQYYYSIKTQSESLHGKIIILHK